jgi:hypothetical protein
MLVLASLAVELAVSAALRRLTRLTLFAWCR